MIVVVEKAFSLFIHTNAYLNTDSLAKDRYLSSASPPYNSHPLEAKFTASPQLNYTLI
jgi:hypothetical protein